MTRWVLSVLLSAMIGVGAAVAEDQDDRSAALVDTNGLKTGCFYPSDVSNWDALNPNYLIVYAPNKNRAFLVNIAPSSPELRNAISVGFEGRDRICGKPGERLVTGRSVGNTYTILDVWKLDSDAVERLQDNKKQRESGVVEPSKDPPGAKVETYIKPNEDKPTAER